MVKIARAAENQREADIRLALKSDNPKQALVDKFGPADAQKIIDAEQFIA